MSDFIPRGDPLPAYFAAQGNPPPAASEPPRGRLVWGLVVVGSLPLVAIIAAWIGR